MIDLEDAWSDLISTNSAVHRSHHKPSVIPIRCHIGGAERFGLAPFNVATNVAVGADVALVTFATASRIRARGPAGESRAPLPRIVSCSLGR